MWDCKVTVLKDNGPRAAAAVRKVGEEAQKKVCEHIQKEAQANIQRDLGYGAEHIEIVGGHKVVAAFPYAVYLEHGTSPHWPPIDALEGWASRHGFETPFLAAQAIAENGTPAYPFFKPAVDSARHMSFSGIKLQM